MIYQFIILIIIIIDILDMFVDVGWPLMWDCGTIGVSLSTKRPVSQSPTTPLLAVLNQYNRFIEILYIPGGLCYILNKDLNIALFKIFWSIVLVGTYY